MFTGLTVWPWVVYDIWLYGKQGLDTSDDAYVDYLLTAKSNQEAVHISVAKTCRLLWTFTDFVFLSLMQ